VLDGNQTIVTMNGIFKPFALVGGRAAATWTMPGGQVSIEPFGQLSSSVLTDLGREARDVERFLSPH